MTARRKTRLDRPVLAVVSFLLTLVAAELFFRAIGFDFADAQAARQRIAPFYLKPLVAMESGLSRREGHLQWTGRVRQTGYASVGGAPEVFADEEPITLFYDRHGFRNPEDLVEWEIVMAGDSFTELGYLADADLFTTRVGELLGVRVKNLGVGSTGPLSQLEFLRNFGKSSSTRVAILVFFEGNDLKDLLREDEALRHFRLTGEPRSYRPNAHSSLFRALSEVMRKPRSNGSAGLLANAMFEGPEALIPVTVTYTPPGLAGLSPRTVELLEQAIAAWGRVSREMGLEPWLAYMPCKFRSLFSRLKLNERATERLRAWSPTGLPASVGELCRTHRVHFIDLSPALDAATSGGNLTYNGIWDTHLTAEGANIVAEVIAAELLQSGQLSLAPR